MVHAWSLHLRALPTPGPLCTWHCPELRAVLSALVEALLASCTLLPWVVLSLE